MAAEWVETLEGAMPERPLAEPWESVFEQFYLEYYRRVVSVVFRLTGSRSEAEDLANDVFGKLYRQRLLPQSDGNVPGWLYRTATNLGIDGLRKNARRRQYERDAAQAAAQSRDNAGPLDEILRDERRRQVRQVLGRLKPVHAQALILRASGFSYHEVAETLGVKRVSVGTLLLRAEQAFRKHYRDLAGTAGEEEI